MRDTARSPRRLHIFFNQAALAWKVDAGAQLTRTSAVYYRAVDGSEPVNDFVLGLGERRKHALQLQIKHLNDLPPNAPPLPFPLTSNLTHGLRELRAHFGSEQYRIIYRRSENLIVLLHAFRKTTNAVPRRDIDIARARWADFHVRMNAPRRSSPRAAGNDAP